MIAFLSDAKSRWATPWVRWESLGTLWPQMVRDVSHRDKTVRASVRPGTRQDEAIISYDVLPVADNLKDANDQTEADLSLPGSPAAVVETPDQASQALPLVETAPGHYEARILAEQQGLYRIKSTGSALPLPEIGYYRESEETKTRAVNVALLNEVSRLTSGSVRPSIDQLLDDKGSLVNERRALWPYLLVLALAINFLELALRKNFFEWLASWLQRHALFPWRRQPA